MQDGKPDEKKELTPEQIAAQAAELESLKTRFGKVVIVVKGKEQELNLLDDGQMEKAKQFMAGGATFAQDKAAFNAEKAAFDEAKKKAEAELQTKLQQAGQPSGSGAARKKLSDVLKENPTIKAKFENGDPTFLDDLGAAVDAAIPESPEPPKQGGVTNDYVRRTIAYETRILPDQKFQLLATKLGRGDSVAGAKMIAAEYKAQVDAGKVDADADYATTFLNVAHGWADELGLRVAPAKPPEEPPAEDRGGREEPPANAGAGAGAGAGAEAQLFKSKADASAWRKERDRKAKAGGQRHSAYDV